MQVTDSAAAVSVGLHNKVRETRRGLLLIASLLGVTNIASAGTNTWTPLGPDGGSVYDIEFHPTDAATMYVATSAGFYRSTDSASSWQHTSAAGLPVYFRPTGLAVDRVHPDRVLIASGYMSTLRSDDRGLSLQVMTGLLPFAPLYIDQHLIAAAGDGSTVYYSMDDFVYCSTDGGASRQFCGQLPFSPPRERTLSRLLVDPANPQTLYGTTYERAYRSTDAGSTWTVIWAEPVYEDDGVAALTIDPQNANRLWLATHTSLRVSDDAGVTWLPVLTGAAVDVDVDPNNSQIVYAAMSDQTLMRTTDGGTTWSAVPAPEAVDTVRKRQLEIHPSDSARLYLFGPTGILASADAGATWDRADAGILATSPEDFSPTETASGHNFFLVSGYGIAGLRPGDSSVDIVVDPPLPDTGGSVPDRATAVLSLPTTVIAGLLDSRVAFSSDLGASWTLAATPPPHWINSLAAAQTQDGAWTVYATTAGGIFRSDDLGNHWSRIGNGLPNGGAVHANYITVGANQTQLYALVHTGGDVLYRSTDSGQNWTPVAGTEPAASGIQVLSAHPADAQTLLLGTFEGVFRTTDGGNTWQALDLLPEKQDAPAEAIAIDPVNPDIIYISSPLDAFSTLRYFGNVFRSVDGGASFQRLMPDYHPGTGVVSLKVTSDQPHRILAAAPGNGVNEISIEPDLELTLTSQSGSATISSPLELTLTATNQGPFDATGVQVEVQLPTATSATTATIDDSQCTVANNVVTCSAGILRNDQTATIQVRTTPTAAGTFLVDADVTGAQPDAGRANNSASVSVSVAALPDTNPGGGDGGGGTGGGDGGGGTGGGGGGGGSFGALALIALLPIGLSRRRRW